MAKKYSNLSGRKISSLTVIKEIDNGERGTYYECLCDCGKMTSATSSQLIFDKKRSCGCLRVGKNTSANRKEILLKRILNDLKMSGKFVCDELSDLQFFEFVIMQPCFYCGELYSKEEFDFSKSAKKAFISDLSIKHNGIDRIDSSIGYTLNNIVPCCSSCNSGKETMLPFTYVEHMKKICLHSGLCFHFWEDVNFKSK